MSEVVAKESNLKAIDINALGDDVETILIDQTVSAYDRSNPLPDAKYRAQLVAPKDPNRSGLNMAKVGTFQTGENAGKEYIIINFDLQILEYYDNSKDSQELLGRQRTFPLMASSVIRHVNGQPTSEMSTILTACGVDFKGQPVGVKALAKLFAQAVTSGHNVGVETQLQGQIETDKKRMKGGVATDKNEWKTVKRGEKSFTNADGSFNHDLEVDGKKVFVKPVIVKYFQL